MVEGPLQELKTAISGSDIEAIKTATEHLMMTMLVHGLSPARARLVPSRGRGVGLARGAQMLGSIGMACSAPACLPKT